MSLEQFMNDSISPWMRGDGPENDIVLSTRIRLARNFQDRVFPIIADEEELDSIMTFFKDHYDAKTFRNYKHLELINIDGLSAIEKRILVEKHLISPYLVNSRAPGVLLSENEQVSIMINEEDHIRMQLYLPGFQLSKSLKEIFLFDDWLEEEINYAFDEDKGYLTSCPTNAGTGMRASVMIHLPALVMTKRISRVIPVMNQLGFVVRGIYGEGSEALGRVFQISNQVTLGKGEEDIVADLESIIKKLVEQERQARIHLLERSGIQLENQIYRSYGVLKHARIMKSHEAATKISNVRLGIDMGIITNIEKNILNELMMLTQPGFLQSYAAKSLSSNERDVLRASLIRERLNLE